MYVCQSGLGELSNRLDLIKTAIIRYKLPLQEYFNSSHARRPISADFNQTGGRSKSRGRIRTGNTYSPNKSGFDIDLDDDLKRSMKGKY